MNFKHIFFFGSCISLFWACDAGDRNDKDVFKDLESYVESVEDTVDQRAIVSWQEIESEYQRRQRQAQQALASTNRDDNAESQERMRELEERYQESKRSYQSGDTDAASSFDQYDNMSDTVLGSGTRQSEFDGDTINRFP